MLNFKLFIRTSKISFREFSQGIKEVLRCRQIIFLLVAYFVVFGICNLLEDASLAFSSFNLAGITCIQLLATIWIVANMWLIIMWCHIWKKMVNKYHLKK